MAIGGLFGNKTLFLLNIQITKGTEQNHMDKMVLNPKFDSESFQRPKKFQH